VAIHVVTAIAVELFFNRMQSLIAAGAALPFKVTTSRSTASASIQYYSGFAIGGLFGTVVFDTRAAILWSISAHSD